MIQFISVWALSVSLQAKLSFDVPGFCRFLAENPGFEDELRWLRGWPSPPPGLYRCLASGPIRPSANFGLPECPPPPGFQGIATSLIGDRQ